MIRPRWEGGRQEVNFPCDLSKPIRCAINPWFLVLNSNWHNNIDRFSIPPIAVLISPLYFRIVRETKYHYGYQIKIFYLLHWFLKFYCPMPWPLIIVSVTWTISVTPPSSFPIAKLNSNCDTFYLAHVCNDIFNWGYQSIYITNPFSFFLC